MESSPPRTARSSRVLETFVSAKKRPLIAVVAHGLEAIAAREIRGLGGGIGHAKAGRGRVWFDGPHDAVLRANLHLRTVERILVPLGEGRAHNAVELAELLAELPLQRFIPTGHAVRVAASARACQLFHTGAIADAVHEALLTRGLRGVLTEREDAPTGRHGERADDWLEADLDEAILGSTEAPAPAHDEPPPTLDVRGTENHWLISVDASGRGLHRRGWRKHPGRSPIRETVAAATLLAAGWTGEGALLDPMCGVGTFVIEAAAIAARRAPGLSRSFASDHFPETNRDRLAELRALAEAAVVPVRAPVEGADRSKASIDFARDHLRRARLAGQARFVVREAAKTPANPEGGLIVLNPPWGLRQPVRTPIEEVVAAIRAARPAAKIVIVSPEAKGKVLWKASLGGQIVFASAI